MRAIEETFETFGKRVLWLGYSGEDDRALLVIDLHDILQEFPNVSAVLKIRPPGERTAYPVIAKVEDEKLCCSITDSMTAIEGRSELQLSLVSPDGVTVKTAIAAAEISRSLSEGGEPPDPVENWIENAELTRQATEEAAKKANDAAKRAEDAAGIGGNIEALTNEDLEGLLK